MTSLSYDHAVNSCGAILRCTIGPAAMSPNALTSDLSDRDAAVGQWHSELLASHLRDCFRAQGRSFNLQLMGEAVNDLLAPRFCTTLVFATGLLLLLSVFA
ncbi:MAG: hypothetical protein M3Y32_11610 [Pseudomonadota bacterium]|nr:hypothetical protein [Pseudomonadota bacterium]